MHDDGDDSAGFWPGYVSAVVCLVQSLLLFTTIMGAAIFVYSLVINAAPKPHLPVAVGSPDAQGDEPPAADARALKSEAETADARPENAAAIDTPTVAGQEKPADKPSAEAAAAPAPTAPPAETAGPDREQDKDKAGKKAEGPDSGSATPPQQPAPPQPGLRQLLSIRFHGDAVIIGQEQVGRIKATIASHAEPRVARWRLEVKTDSEDRLLARAGYMRLMAVRNALLTAGISGSAIETRIAPAPDGDGKDDMTVRVTGEPAR